MGHIQQPPIFKGEALAGQDVLEDNAIRPGGFLIPIQTQVDHAEKAAQEKPGLRPGAGGIMDHFPVITKTRWSGRREYFLPADTTVETRFLQTASLRWISGRVKDKDQAWSGIHADRPGQIGQSRSNPGSE